MGKADYLKLIGTRGLPFFSFLLFLFFGGKAKMKLLYQMAMMITLTIYFTGVGAEPEAELEEEQLEVKEHPEEPEERLKNMIQKAVKRLAIPKECRGLAWYCYLEKAYEKIYNRGQKNR